MSSDSGNRSSLEEMLEALRRRDTKPKDVLPGLPARPAIRGRLPSQKRTMLIKFEVAETEEERALRRYQEMVLRSNVFRSKTFAKVEEPEESPYGKMPELINCKGRWEPVNTLDSAQLEEKFKWSNTTDSVEMKKPHVWCRVPDVGWELGNIKSFKGEDANVLLSDGKVLTVSIGNLLPANPDLLDDVDDLMQLGYLNEPSVLHSLKHRHSRDMIYTKAGDVLVAINPFKKVHLCGNDPVAAYKGKTTNSPHVCAIADSAFSKMMKDGGNQSIIISGESGSGKTETAKIAMQYLAAVGGGSGIEHKVLQSNTILEAFGNAKTSRNDNSSRFGKLIEMHFHIGGKICGVKIQTFLLEKSRVVGRAKGERSYHVFYQLCAGAPALLREKLNLKAASEYEYLKQSDCLRISDVDDAKRFHELMEALNIVQISKEDQENAFSMLAAVLWLGNIEFSVIDNEDHVEVVSSEGVTSAAKLMGCKVHELMLTLTTRRIEAVNDEIVQKLTLSQAIDTRDALAKSIYSSLFDWLVEQINKSLEVGKLSTGRSINILDIYGFESFHKNNFEQFCINYANERLQQHFNRHLFKLEQEEYIQDGIDWTNVEFIDNADCLNLIEKKPQGLLSILDEESTSLEATDLSFEYKLKQRLNGSPCFNGAREGAFQVCHYAGVVLYEAHGFLEKNRDPLPSDCIQLLSSCDCQPPQLFASRMLNCSRNPVSSTIRVSSVDSQKQIATKFKGQLFNLLQQLENTTPHFIYCIRPNSNKIPGVYEDKLVLQQLRCCGILEVVRMSRSGYPYRITHYQFAERYGFLLLKNVVSEDPLNVAVSVLQKLNIRREMYQVGYTKLFFRAGQIVLLENMRNHTMQRILWVQKSLRSLQSRRSFQKLKNGVTTLQSFIRGSLVRKNLIGSKTWYIVFNRMTVQIQASKDQASVTVELEIQVLKAEVALRQKEEENVILRKQLQEYEMRCSDNEAKMKSMQESWQKQMTSLQMNLLPVKKAHLPGSLDASPAQYSNDSMDTMPTGTSTPEATPGRHGLISNGGLARNSDNTQNAVGHLVKEFEQRKRDFEDNVRVLVEVRPGQSGSSTNPQDELKKLKARFRSWNKEYRVQLRDAKRRIHKLVVSDGEKASDELKKLKARFRSWNKEYRVQLRDAKRRIHKLVASDGEKARKKWWKLWRCAKS